MQEIDISKDLSAYSKRIMDFIQQANSIGVNAAVELLVEADGRPVVVARYVSPAGGGVIGKTPTGPLA